MENFVEQLVAEHYRTKGYFVSTNIWIPFQSTRKRNQRGQSQSYRARSWTDIDVIARNEEELLLIQVKAIINQKSTAQKIIKYFKRLTNYLNHGVAPDGLTSIAWWTKNVKVRNIVVYEVYSPPSYLKLLTDKKIEAEHFSKYFDNILDYVESKKGVKEENAVMRLIHFLKKQKLLTRDNNITTDKSKTRRQKSKK